MADHIFYRLLETCVRTGANAIVPRGFPPFWRINGRFWGGAIPPFDEAEFDAILSEAARWSGSTEGIPGCTDMTLKYAGHRFRANALGSPRVEAIAFSLVSSDAPAFREDGGAAWLVGAVPRDQGPSWDAIFKHCATQPGAAMLLVPTCPPVGWSKWGLHVLRTHPLTAEDVGSMLKHFTPPDPDIVPDETGHKDFAILLNGSTYMRFSVFGEPSPSAVVCGCR